MHRWEHKQARQEYEQKVNGSCKELGQNARGKSPKDEYKDFCVCLLKCTCIEMMWSVYEIMRLYTLQVKYYT